MPQRCPNPEARPVGSLRSEAAELGEPGGQGRDRTADLAVSAGLALSGSVRDDPPEPRSPCLVGWRRRWSSGLIRTRNGWCG
jgi:hypothetical protein